MHESSESLTSWRLQVTRLNFKVSYKNGKSTQSDAFSRLRARARMVTDGSDDIPAFISKDTSTSSDLTHENLEKAITIIDDGDSHYGENDLQPKDLLAGVGRCITAKLFQSVCRMHNVYKYFTTACNPETNGQTVWFNKTIKTMIRNYPGDRGHGSTVRKR